jgi:hypothetical protein
MPTISTGGPDFLCCVKVVATPSNVALGYSAAVYSDQLVEVLSFANKGPKTWSFPWAGLPVGEVLLYYDIDKDTRMTSGTLLSVLSAP